MNKEMEQRRDDLCVQQWDMYSKGTTRYTDEHIKATQGATDRCSGIAVGFNAAAEIYEKEKIGPLVETLKFYADNNTHKVAFDYNKNIHQARLEGASPIFVDSGAKACETLKRLGYKDE